MLCTLREGRNQSTIDTVSTGWHTVQAAPINTCNIYKQNNITETKQRCFAPEHVQYEYQLGTKHQLVSTTNKQTKRSVMRKHNKHKAAQLHNAHRQQIMVLAATVTDIITESYWFAALQVMPSIVCTSVCPAWAPNLRTEMDRKTKTGVYAHRDWCDNFELKRSKTRLRVRVTNTGRGRPSGNSFLISTVPSAKRLMAHYTVCPPTCLLCLVFSVDWNKNISSLLVWLVVQCSSESSVGNWF